MMWQVVCRIGKEDNYEPKHAEIGEQVYVDIDRLNDKNSVQSNVKTKLQDAGLYPSALVVDLLHLAMTVYSADKRVRRKAAYNRWERGFRVFLPVSDPLIWETSKPTLQKMLNFITSDNWDLEFRPITTDISIQPHQCRLPGINKKISAVALLSGGLDSFTGAIDLLHKTPRSVAFVSHYGRGNVTHKVQDQIYSLLREYYPKQIEDFPFFVQASIGESSEPSSRSRSMLFLSLGTAVASTLEKGTPLYIIENGFMSLNVPLAHDRIGSLSTRTTHPYFLEMYQQVLQILNIKVPIENPCRFHTKGEMLENAKKKNLKATQEGIKKTLSCSNSIKQRFAGVSPYRHCGYCLPCLVRQAAIYKAGLRDITYGVNILQNPQGEDLHALKMAMRRMEASQSPLIFDVLQAGPIPDSQQQYADVYGRGMLELKQFLSQPSKSK